MDLFLQLVSRVLSEAQARATEPAAGGEGSSKKRKPETLTSLQIQKVRRLQHSAIRLQALETQRPWKKCGSDILSVNHAEELYCLGAVLCARHPQRMVAVTISTRLSFSARWRGPAELSCRHALCYAGDAAGAARGAW